MQTVKNMLVLRWQGMTLTVTIARSSQQLHAIRSRELGEIIVVDEFLIILTYKLFFGVL